MWGSGRSSGVSAAGIGLAIADSGPAMKTAGSGGQRQSRGDGVYKRWWRRFFD